MTECCYECGGAGAIETCSGCKLVVDNCTCEYEGDPPEMITTDCKDCNGTGEFDDDIEEEDEEDEDGD